MKQLTQICAWAQIRRLRSGQGGICMKEVLLSAKGLCKQFPQDAGKEQVLKEIDVDIYKGDFTVIMGSSGAGKSTLLYALSEMDSITAGKVLYKGAEISRYKERQMALLRFRYRKTDRWDKCPSGSGACRYTARCFFRI